MVNFINTMKKKIGQFAYLKKNCMSLDTHCIKTQKNESITFTNLTLQIIHFEITIQL